MRKLLTTVAILLCGSFVFAQTLPPAEADSLKRLNSSPRHGEWVTYDTGGGDKVQAWIVYPERADKAPVVIVIHEIFGLTDWVRAVTDQLAAEGYIAIAPDFLSGKGPDGKGSAAVGQDAARGLIAQLTNDEIVRRLNATGQYAMSLPSATKQFAVVGYCWGGGISFNYATQQPNLAAAAVFYGTPPATPTLANIRAPVLAFYGGSDARVTSTAVPTDTEMKKLGKRFDYQIFDGAGHAFLRQQDGQNGANLKAAQGSWPKLLTFLKQSFAAKIGLSWFDQLKLALPATTAAIAMSVGIDPAIAKSHGPAADVTICNDHILTASSLRGRAITVAMAAADFAGN